MTEYIDREMLKETMQKYRCSDCTSEKSLDCPLCQLHEPFAEISKIPTVDAVQVILCKDCQYFHQDWNIKVCKHWNCHTTTPDAYCSYAKMKDGDT